jgi:hypothetical protein
LPFDICVPIPAAADKSFCLQWDERQFASDRDGM